MATAPSFIFKSLLILMLGIPFWGSGQIKIKKIGQLADEINEASGIIKAKDGNFWMLNDSGDDPVLYLVKPDGSIVKKVWIENAENVDWEALSKDDYGSVFIGDIGNNDNNRKDLKIYKVWEQELMNNDTAMAFTISYSYEDQQSFPPSENQMNFDAEGLVSFRKQLYIFTKNRTKPYSGYCYIYKVNITNEPQKAIKIDSIFTGNIKETSWITDASLSKDKRHLVLLSQKSIWYISDFYEDEFSSGYQERKELLHLSQKEAVCWDSDSLIIADERNPGNGGFLYSFQTSKFIEKLDSIRRNEIKLLAKTFEDTIRAEVNLKVKGMAYYELFDSNGKKADYGKIGLLEKGKYEFYFVPNKIMNSYYMLNIQIGSRPHGFFINIFNEENIMNIKEMQENQEKEEK